ncbi:hypothetical protein BGL34_05880 [Fructilactobacillus lindneri]|uniref:Uncharacterized protein n=2 Tax=Fructilactobacillus lindneri TaxID=53444 RepID=A0A0R2K0J0_9LACO|nr:hypothetical protein [Fructilactobacillus lindneri]ANZ57444.1 hypothetical protein AYR60_00905 [Fructilactobacillus lindneri]ANZ58712.1 hypothetical protein AYR59_00905 [Fructilactobacillus lindneri]KRN80055.1 hypothetical protein IV52_GL000173 [Fructilactobacillus lindneri DSM 20690 = JCM 11027]POG97930.1 hypothetical protein BGL31_05345 [Fructilactobacillus lindneri]POG99262.1 hypothetical protein BGL32_05370 [Fructilactobacillus lindneri]
MEMTERQLIQEIFNTVDVIFEFENVDEDSKEYTLQVKRQDNDIRDINEINDEMKHYFKEANFDYQEEVEPQEIDCDIRVQIKR